MTFETILKASLVLAACAAIRLGLWRSSASTRHAILSAGLISAGLLPVLGVLLPAWNAPLAAPRFLVDGGTAAATASAWGIPWTAIWAVGVAVVLARLVAAHLRVAMLARGGASAGESRGVPVRQSDRIPTPMTWGVLRPVILLPAGGATDRVLAHETAHALRRDGLWQLAAEMTRAVYWFHPLVWWTADQAAYERERACDDAVLTTGASAADYAGDLISMARENAEPVAAVAAVGQAAGLEGRIRAILDRTLDRRAAGRAFIAAAVLAAIGLSGPLAALRAQNDEVHKVGGDVTAPRVVEKVEPQYTQRAKDDRAQGTVILYLIITEQGVGEDIQVTTGLHPDLDEAAVQAVRQWRFEPGTKKGKPVRVAATVQVNFKLR